MNSLLVVLSVRQFLSGLKEFCQFDIFRLKELTSRLYNFDRAYGKDKIPEFPKATQLSFVRLAYYVLV